MTGIGWIILGIIALALAASWVIVMGADPRKWKGGGRHGGK